MSAIVIDGEIVHFEVLGRGKPVIFLHGWVGSWRYWIPNMQAISFSFRGYAIDFWGYGDTAKKQNRYTLEHQVTLLEDFIHKMGIGKISLIGHGLGAVIGVLFCQSHLSQVDRLMLMGLPLKTNILDAKVIALTPAEQAERLLGRNHTIESTLLEVSKTDVSVIRKMYSDVQQIELAMLVRESSLPSLYVNGKYDPLIEIPSLEDVSFLPEESHYILFEQSGHFPMLDEPSKFNRLLIDFLNLGQDESPRVLQLKEEWKRRVR